MQYTYSISTEADQQLAIQFLEDRLYEHNAQKLNNHNGKLFSILVRSDSQQIIGGIAGWTWAGACEITQLWVDTSFQKQGIGKQLLLAAETEAKNNHCDKILVRTYSFQAPEFYEKHGYYTTHIIDGFPKGHQYHILIRTIA